MHFCSILAIVHLLIIVDLGDIKSVCGMPTKRTVTENEKTQFTLDRGYGTSDYFKLCSSPVFQPWSRNTAQTPAPSVGPTRLRETSTPQVKSYAQALLVGSGTTSSPKAETKVDEKNEWLKNRLEEQKEKHMEEAQPGELSIKSKPEEKEQLNEAQEKASEFAKDEEKLGTKEAPIPESAQKGIQDNIPLTPPPVESKETSLRSKIVEDSMDDSPKTNVRSKSSSKKHPPRLTKSARKKLREQKKKDDEKKHQTLPSEPLSDESKETFSSEEEEQQPIPQVGNPGDTSQAERDKFISLLQNAGIPLTSSGEGQYQNAGTPSSSNGEVKQYQNPQPYNPVFGTMPYPVTPTQMGPSSIRTVPNPAYVDDGASSTRSSGNTEERRNKIFAPRKITRTWASEAEDDNDDYTDEDSFTMSPTQTVPQDENLFQETSPRESMYHSTDKTNQTPTIQTLPLEFNNDLNSVGRDIVRTDSTSTTQTVPSTTLPVQHNVDQNSVGHDVVHTDQTLTIPSVLPDESNDHNSVGRVIVRDILLIISTFIGIEAYAVLQKSEIEPESFGSTQIVKLTDSGLLVKCSSREGAEALQEAILQEFQELEVELTDFSSNVICMYDLPEGVTFEEIDVAIRSKFSDVAFLIQFVPYEVLGKQEEKIALLDVNDSLLDKIKGSSHIYVREERYEISVVVKSDSYYSQTLEEEEEEEEDFIEEGNFEMSPTASVLDVDEEVGTRDPELSLPNNVPIMTPPFGQNERAHQQENIVKPVLEVSTLHQGVLPDPMKKQTIERVSSQQTIPMEDLRTQTKKSGLQAEELSVQQLPPLKIDNKSYLVKEGSVKTESVATSPARSILNKEEGDQETPSSPSVADGAGVSLHRRRAAKKNKKRRERMKQVKKSKKKSWEMSSESGNEADVKPKDQTVSPAPVDESVIINEEEQWDTLPLKYALEESDETVTSDLSVNVLLISSKTPGVRTAVELEKSDLIPRTYGVTDIVSLPSSGVIVKCNSEEGVYNLEEAIIEKLEGLSIETTYFSSHIVCIHNVPEETTDDDINTIIENQFSEVPISVDYMPYEVKRKHNPKIVLLDVGDKLLQNMKDTAKIQIEKNVCRIQICSQAGKKEQPELDLKSDPSKNFEVLIKDLPQDINARDISEIVLKKYEEKPSQIRLSTSEDDENTKTAKLEVSLTLLGRMAWSPDIPVGWKVRRIETLLNLHRCARCQLLGHETKLCRGQYHPPPMNHELCLDCCSYNQLNEDPEKQRDANHETDHENCPTKREYLLKYLKRGVSSKEESEEDDKLEEAQSEPPGKSQDGDPNATLSPESIASSLSESPKDGKDVTPSTTILDQKPDEENRTAQPLTHFQPQEPIVSSPPTYSTRESLKSQHKYRPPAMRSFEQSDPIRITPPVVAPSGSIGQPLEQFPQIRSAIPSKMVYVPKQTPVIRNDHLSQSRSPSRTQERDLPINVSPKTYGQPSERFQQDPSVRRETPLVTNDHQSLARSPIQTQKHVLPDSSSIINASPKTYPTHNIGQPSERFQQSPFIPRETPLVTNDHQSVVRSPTQTQRHTLPDSSSIINAPQMATLPGHVVYPFEQFQQSQAIPHFIQGPPVFGNIQFGSMEPFLLPQRNLTNQSVVERPPTIENIHFGSGVHLPPSFLANTTPPAIVTQEPPPIQTMTAHFQQVPHSYSTLPTKVDDGPPSNRNIHSLPTESPEKFNSGNSVASTSSDSHQQVLDDKTIAAIQQSVEQYLVARGIVSSDKSALGVTNPTVREALSKILPNLSVATPTDEPSSVEERKGKEKVSEERGSAENQARSTVREPNLPPHHESLGVLIRAKNAMTDVTKEMGRMRINSSGLVITRAIFYPSGDVLLLCDSAEGAEYLRNTIRRSSTLDILPWRGFSSKVRIDAVPQNCNISNINTAIRKKFGEPPKKVEFKQYTYGGSVDKKMAFVNVSESLLEAMERDSTIVVLGVPLKINASVKPPRCLNCKLFGHRTDLCRAPTRPQPKPNENCVDCTYYNKRMSETGLRFIPRRANHRTGSENCPALRPFTSG